MVVKWTGLAEEEDEEEEEVSPRSHPLQALFCTISWVGFVRLCYLSFDIALLKDRPNPKIANNTF